jgi:SAM-dependent methyltransferase
MAMAEITETHELVRDSYAEMLKGVEKRPDCCATSPAARLAGYEDTQRHGEAASASFGCGDPLAFSEVREGETVLDLGSGAGLDLLIAAEKTGPRGKVIGVDMTDEMIAAALRNASSAGHTNIEVRKGLIEALPVEDGSVDWVISNCVINLAPEKDKVFAEITRVLKPGGRFSISDIVVNDLPAIIRDSAAAWSACVAGAISEQEYIDGLEQAGLRDVSVTERLVYDSAQLGAILCEEIPGLDLDKATIDALLEEHAGKVWSAKFVGTKPG